MSTMTYRAATTAHLTALTGMGWTVRSDLKVPHATAPDGSVRMWFKPQAILAGPGTDMGVARSLHSDMRTVTTVMLVFFARKLAADLASDNAAHAARFA